MLSGMRKATRNWIAGIFIGVLVISFAVVGVNDVFQLRPNDAVSFGRDGAEISRADFQREFETFVQIESEQARAQPGQTPLTREAARQQGLDRAIQSRMEQEEAMRVLAESLGFGVSPAMIARELGQMQAFRSSITGQFDRDVYVAALAGRNFTPALFEARVRNELLAQQVLAVTAGGVHVPESMARLVWLFQAQQRTVSAVAVTPASVPAPPNPTDEQLTAFYEELKPQLQRPEFRTLTVVSASEAMFAPRVAPTDQDIRAHFERRSPALSTPERRSFVEIVAPDEATARQAAQRLATGEDPAVIAAALQLNQPATQTDVTIDRVTDAAVGKAIFELAQPGITPPIQGRLAWTVAKVTAITPGKVATLEAFRDQMRQELVQQGAQDLLATAGTTFDEAITNGQTLEQAAQAAGFSLTTHPPVDARGLAADGTPVTALASQPEILTAAFRNVAPDVLNPLQDGSFFAVRSDTVETARALTFDEVRAQLPDAWRQRARGQAMQARAAEIVTRAGAEGRLPTGAGLQAVTTDRTLTRGDADQAIFTPQALDVVFSTPVGAAASFPTPTGAIVVFRVSGATTPDAAAASEQITELRGRLVNPFGEDLVQTVVQGAVSRVAFERNEDLFRAAVGAAQEEEPQP